MGRVRCWTGWARPSTTRWQMPPTRPPVLSDGQSDDEEEEEPVSDFAGVDAAGDPLPPSELEGGVVEPVGFVLEEVGRESVE